MTKWAKEIADKFVQGEAGNGIATACAYRIRDKLAVALDEAQRKGLRAAVQFIRDHVDGVDIGVGTQEIPVSASMLANELEEYIKQGEAEEVN